MKKSFFSLILFTGVLLFCFVSSVWAAQKDHRNQIKFTKSTIISVPITRMPVFIPVQGWYDAVTKSIEITFLQDTGGATISVQGMTYSTNGEAGHTECIVLPENTEGTVCISVECASGSYMGYVDVN